MASSESMDETFRARVNKIFGSLSSSQSAPVNSLWSLTDDEVEKKEWSRNNNRSDRDDEIPLSSSFDGLKRKNLEKNSKTTRKVLEDDLEDLNDDDDEQSERGASKQSFKRGGDGDDRDEWEIRSSIGLDCTLDYEEEEDEYDKLAEGRENSGDRVYMSDITDHVHRYSMHDTRRDPRANNQNARVRLEEDAAAVAAAEKFNSQSDKSLPNVVDPCIAASGNDCKLKSILKRKDNAAVKPSKKRVRFNPACKEDDYEEALKIGQEYLGGSSPLMDTKASDDGSLVPKNKPRVPDYVVNPSKYTRYSLDSSSEIDEESNSQACIDFLEQVKRSKPVVSGWHSEDASADVLKSVTFIPRKKTSDAMVVDNSIEAKQNHEDDSKQSSAEAGFRVGIAVVEVQQSEVGAMEEDEPETVIVDRSGSSQKSGRHYRTKSRLEEDPVP